MLKSLKSLLRPITNPALIRSWLLACLLCLCVVVLAASLINWTLLPELLTTNAWPSRARNQVVGALATLCVMAVGLCYVSAQRHSAEAVELQLKRGLLLVPLSLLPALLCADRWFKAPLTFLTLLAAFGWLTERTALPLFQWWETRQSQLNTAPQATPARPVAIARRVLGHRLFPLLVVTLAALGYTALSSYVHILNHWRFGSGAYDLAIFDNMMWKALEGEPFRSTVMYGEAPRLSLEQHSEFAMLFFLPFYAAVPRAETLLVLQAALLGFAAVPLYLFSKMYITRWAAVALALCYLLYAPMHGAQYYDFHWLTIAPAFHFLLFYGLAKKHAPLAIFSTAFLLLLREDLAPGLAVLGLVLVASGKRPSAGIMLALFAGVFFLINKFVVMPSFGSVYFAERYSEMMTPEEHNYGSVIKTIVTNPAYTFDKLLTHAKVEYLLHLLAPVALIPLRRGAFVALLVPGALFTVVMTWGAAYSIKYQYSIHLLPYIFAALPLYLAWSPAAHRGSLPARGRATLLAIVLSSICHSTVFGLVLKPSSFVGGYLPVVFELSEEERTRYEQLRSLVEQVPEAASVTSTDIEAPHISNRAHIYAVAQDRTAGQYLLINPSSFHLARTKENLRLIMEPGAYGLVDQQGDMTLWKRGHESPQTAAAWRKLSRQLGIRPAGDHKRKAPRGPAAQK